MKELTIEEKAKRYDEALENARHLCAYPTNKPFISDLKDLFPELVETEDERMLRVLIEGFNVLDKDDEWYGKITNGQIQNWLKKQGDKISAIEGFETEFERQVSHLIASAINREHEYNEGYVKWTANALLNFAKHELEKQGEHKKFRDSIQVGDKVTRNEDGVLVNLSQLNRVAKKDEKQGENTYNKKLSELLHKVICHYINDTSIPYSERDEVSKKIIPHVEQLEKQGEQKPVDKIEPKFHKDDWIIHQGTENIYQVVAVIDNQYQLKYSDNYTIQNCVDVERCSRLYDVAKDAKDGDVLAVDNVIFMYKRTLANHIVSYCKLINDIFESNVDARTCCEGNTYVHPATKEQCDLLFQKMKEAGYEWDAEKKELKKIKQEKDMNNKLTDFEYSLKHIMEEAIECGDTRNLKADADMLIRLAQKSTEWREDDKRVTK